MSWIKIRGHRLNIDRIVDYEVSGSTMLEIWYGRTEREVVKHLFVGVESEIIYRLDVAKGIRKKVAGNGKGEAK